jgi:hypothetical protein
MRRWTFLFRPGWIALALVVVGFTYLSLTVLAPWQLGKNTMTSRENNQIEASLSADPVPVTSLLPHRDSSAPDFQWRRVTATGRYLPAAQALARLRLIGGAPGFEVLTAFAVDGGPTVLVNRAGLEVARLEGAAEWDAPPMLAALADRRGGRPAISFLTIWKCTRPLIEMKRATPVKRKRR